MNAYNKMRGKKYLKLHSSALFSYRGVTEASKAAAAKAQNPLCLLNH